MEIMALLFLIRYCYNLYRILNFSIIIMHLLFEPPQGYCAPPLTPIPSGISPPYELITPTPACELLHGQPAYLSMHTTAILIYD